MDVFTQLKLGWPALCAQTAAAFAGWQRIEPTLADVDDLEHARRILHTTDPATVDERDVLLLALLRRVEHGPRPELAAQVVMTLLVPAAAALANQVRHEFDEDEAPGLVMTELWHVLTHQRRWFAHAVAWQVVRELRRRVHRQAAARRRRFEHQVLVDEQQLTTLVEQHAGTGSVQNAGEVLITLIAGAVAGHELDLTDAQLVIDKWVRSSGRGGVPARCRLARDRVISALASAVA